jgi:hypothetical protein
LALLLLLAGCNLLAVTSGRGGGDGGRGGGNGVVVAMVATTAMAVAATATVVMGTMGAMVVVEAVPSNKGPSSRPLPGLLDFLPALLQHSGVRENNPAFFSTLAFLFLFQHNLMWKLSKMMMMMMISEN